MSEPTLSLLCAAAFRRDGCCIACGISARAVLAAHHVVPVQWGGRDALSNLVTLCANCHRSVHWLATGDRSVPAHAYGLGPSRKSRRRILQLARRIRSRRVRIVVNGGTILLSVE